MADKTKITTARARAFTPAEGRVAARCDGNQEALDEVRRALEAGDTVSDYELRPELGM